MGAPSVDVLDSLRCWRQPKGSQFVADAAIRLRLVRGRPEGQGSKAIVVASGWSHQPPKTRMGDVAA
jgi:hypothetical protein